MRPAPGQLPRRTSDAFHAATPPLYVESWPPEDVIGERRLSNDAEQVSSARRRTEAACAPTRRRDAQLGALTVHERISPNILWSG